MNRFVAPRMQVMLCLLMTLAPTGCDDDGQRTLTLGIPTTVQDSGLLDYLLPDFKRAHPEYHIRFVAAGSGELLALAARGDLDVVLAHSPRAEEEFVDAGYGTRRRPVMENEFVIAGPPADPAGIRGLNDAEQALRQVARAGAPFLSRGDDSGTHRRELELWGEVGPRDRGASYREVGQGMGDVLRAASELDAYTLCDRATFLNLRESLELAILVEDDPRLRNVYSVIPSVDARELEGARAFAQWLTSEAGQRVIEEYGRERFGASLYRPTN